MLKVTIRAHQMGITAALKEYAEKKLEKLDKYFDHIQSVTVELSEAETASSETRHVASVVVKIPGALLRASHESQDMYASIDGIYEKAAIQLKKHKEKLRSHKRTNNQRTVDVVIENEKEEKKSPEFEDNLYVVKPISPEDAAILLSERKTPFLVFHNLETLKINVVYSLDSEGEYGVVETN